MFARFSSAFILALPVFAAATAIPRGPSNQCNTGSLQCCNSSSDSSNLSTVAALLIGLLHIDIGPVTGLVGVTCSPITGVGLGANSCTSQPVCCTDNSFNGVVALGCSPVNL